MFVLHMISLRSSLRRKLLTYFYVNRSARVYVRQLAEKLGVDSTNLSRELARLEQEGLLESEVEGRQRYYRINPRYTHLNAVFSLLQGTVGLVPTLKSSLQRVGGIEHAYIYGSFAKNDADAASDIDVLILGQPDAADLATEVAKGGEDFEPGDQLYSFQAAGAEAEIGSPGCVSDRHLARQANRGHLIWTKPDRSP